MDTAFLKCLLTKTYDIQLLETASSITYIEIHNCKIQDLQMSLSNEKKSYPYGPECVPPLLTLYFHAHFQSFNKRL